MESKHPLIEIALSKVDEYARVTEKLVDDIEDASTQAIFSLDFEALQDLKNAAQDAMVKLHAYIEEQDKRYQKMINAVNKFGEFDDTETVMILWDLKRPIIYKIQRLEEIIETINKVFT
jgi:hypothetical protein